MSVKYLISWRPLRGLNSRPSAYKTTLQWRHASVPKLLAAPAHAAEGAGGQAGAGHRGQLGSIPITPTIQSFQTADFRADSKEAVSVGIFAGIVALVRSPVTLSVFHADMSINQAILADNLLTLERGLAVRASDHDRRILAIV